MWQLRHNHDEFNPLRLLQGRNDMAAADGPALLRSLLNVWLAGMVVLGAAGIGATASADTEATPATGWQLSQAGGTEGRQPGSNAPRSNTMQSVIVTLKVENYSPANTAAVAAVQDRVLAAVAKLGVEVNRKYSNLPQMALTVSPEALQALRGNADVVSIEVDGLSVPMR